MIKVSASLYIGILLISTSIAQNYQKYDAFDWELAKVINEKEKSNFIISPLSTKLALAMIYPGLRGAAAKEIEDALNLNLISKQTVGQKFSSIIKSMETNEETCELNIGATVFVDNSFQIDSNYRQQLQHDYNSTVQLVDFGSEESTKAKMNNWCSEATKGKLQQMFTGGEFDSDTVMILLNAIFFKGEWQFPFDENKTESEKFYVTSNSISFIPMMSLQETSFDYNKMDSLQAEFIRLPYMGDKFAMYILYPYEVSRVETLVNKMSPELLSVMVKNKYPGRINLKLPKFRFDSKTELIEVLKMMNITEIFGPKANLESMGRSPNGPLSISNIMQKSGIDVNEKGSTAYAATYAGISTRMEIIPIDITINRPFLFLIVDEPQNTIIFIGKVTDPSSLPTSQERLVDGHNNGSQKTTPINIFFIFTLILFKIFF